MRSRLMRWAPASSARPSIRPSTWAGTPDGSFSGHVPSPAGQLWRARAGSPPMPAARPLAARAGRSRGEWPPRERARVRVAVEAGWAAQVVAGEFPAVLDPLPAGLGRVAEEQPAEGPERLAADGGLRLLVHQDHLAARVGQLGGRDKPGQAGSDD